MRRIGQCRDAAVSKIPLVSCYYIISRAAVVELYGSLVTKWLGIEVKAGVDPKNPDGVCAGDGYEAACGIPQDHFWQVFTWGGVGICNK